MALKEALLEWVPDAYYENGTKAECIWYKIFNMFDVHSQSFKQVKEKRDMDKKKELNSVPIWGPEFNSRTGKLVKS